MWIIASEVATARRTFVADSARRAGARNPNPRSFRRSLDVIGLRRVEAKAQPFAQHMNIFSEQAFVRRTDFVNLNVAASHCVPRQPRVAKLPGPVLANHRGAQKANEGGRRLGASGGANVIPEIQGNLCRVRVISPTLPYTSTKEREPRGLTEGHIQRGERAGHMWWSDGEGGLISGDAAQQTVVSFRTGLRHQKVPV